ncbi:MAG: LysM peptidoglycan-binding domain-containing protein [Planctomycetales bacterium]|nr:LysM peptidoglycan-binding domain-containing protein [Planctomycetales bacterium]
MNTFKTAVVLATLLGVGYGVHVVLNKPIPNPGPMAADGWGTLPDIDQLAPPDVSLDGTTPLGAPAATTVDNATPPLGSFPELPDLSPAPNDGAAVTQEIAQSSFQAYNVPQNQISNATPGAQPSPLAQNHLPPGGYQAAPPANTNVGVGLYPSIPPTHMQSSPTQSVAPAGVPNGLQVNHLAPVPAVDPSMASQNFANAGADPEAFADNSASSLPQSQLGSFPQSWLTAQQWMQQGQLAQALQQLSPWYTASQLSANEREQLIPLLDQLAGTVIYSRESYLESPYQSQGQETLASVAAMYQVPVEFLARVNGLGLEDTLSPGQSLKVIRGPFRAALSRERRELILYLGDYYAGRFSVGIGRDLPFNADRLTVIEKSGARPYVDAQTGQQIAPNDPENPYGSAWIGLQAGPPVTAINLGIHGYGEAIDASDTRGCISVSQRDAEDLAAILSVGSTVTVTR